MFIDAALRQRAEAAFRDSTALSPAQIETLSPDAIQKMLHEFGVHQIELEMQNKDLRQAQLELHRSRARYFDLYDQAPVGYCTVSDTGHILEANLTAASLLGLTRGALVKQSITRAIASADQDSYYLHCKQLIKTGIPQSCELQMVKSDGTQFWAQLMMSVVPHPAAEPVKVRPAEFRIVLSHIGTRKEIEQALAESRAQLHEYLARREVVNEEDRKHIASEVHDELGQILTGLQLNLSVINYQFAAKNPQLRDHLQQTMTLTHRAIDAVRNVTNALRPAILDMGIVSALEWKARRFSANTGIQCSVFPGDTELELDESHAIALYRIVQESLTNIARHAGAQNVEITLTRETEDHVLKVRDNGCGFNVGNKLADTFGLLGIQERASMLAGVASIHSQPGSGTEIVVRIPVEPKLTNRYESRRQTD